MSVKVKLDWDGPEHHAKIKTEMRRRITACCIMVAAQARRLLSVEGAGKGKKGKLAHGANPSAPGEPPRKQTGALHANVNWGVEGDVGRVGIPETVDYGVHLQLGTRRIKPRPWLDRALNECRGRINALLSKPMN